MYEYLRGSLAGVEADHAVIECGGVGYRLLAPAPVLSALRGLEGQEILLYTHLHIADPELKLFGFQTRQQRELFRLFQSVAQVGPSLALALVAASGRSQVLEAIATGDPTPLLVVKGVGKKTAERICVELKDRISKASFAVGGSRAMGDLVGALVALGYSRNDAHDAASKALDAHPGEKNVETLLRIVLRNSSEAGAG